MSASLKLARADLALPALPSLATTSTVILRTERGRTRLWAAQAGSSTRTPSRSLGAP